MTNGEVNLVEAIRTVKNQIAEMEREFERTVAPYKNGLAALIEMNTVCTECGGTGRTLRSRVCAEDDRPDPNDPTDYVRCKRCHGSGEEPKEV